MHRSPVRPVLLPSGPVTLLAFASSLFWTSLVIVGFGGFVIRFGGGGSGVPLSTGAWGCWVQNYTFDPFPSVRESVIQRPPRNMSNMRTMSSQFAVQNKQLLDCVSMQALGLLGDMGGGGKFTGPTTFDHPATQKYNF